MPRSGLLVETTFAVTDAPLNVSVAFAPRASAPTVPRAFRDRGVQLGLLENGFIQVKTGIAENEVVATSNINTLFDGVLVRQMN